MQISFSFLAFFFSFFLSDRGETMHFETEAERSRFSAPFHRNNEFGFTESARRKSVSLLQRSVILSILRRIYILAIRFVDERNVKFCNILSNFFHRRQLPRYALDDIINFFFAQN